MLVSSIGRIDPHTEIPPKIIFYTCTGYFLSITPETIILLCFFSKVFNQSAIRIFYCTFIGELDVSQKHSTDSISTFSGVIYNEWKCVFSKMWQWSMETRNSAFIYFAFGIKDKGLSALNKQLNILRIDSYRREIKVLRILSPTIIYKF